MTLHSDHTVGQQVDTQPRVCKVWWVKRMYKRPHTYKEEITSELEPDHGRWLVTWKNAAVDRQRGRGAGGSSR